MSKQIDGLAALVRLEYGMELDERSIFLFCGRKEDRMLGIHSINERRITMKKATSMIITMALVFSLMSIFIPHTNAEPITAQGADFVHRSDGTWYFPLPSQYYNNFSDWAGCPGWGICPFHNVSEPQYGDDYHTGQAYGHNGFDVATGGNKCDVYAAASGTAYCSYSSSARGNYVVVEHSLGNGYSYYSYYQHLSAISVANGTIVTAGQTIGKVGNTGGNYGIHLHFGIVLGAIGHGINAPDSLEGNGWVLTPGFQEGRICNNPALNSPAGFPTGDINSLRPHAGSVKYTFNISEVAIGEYEETPHGSEMANGYERTIPDGNYLIGNAANPRYYLDIEGAAFPAEASTNVQVAGALTGDPPSFDVWTVKYTGDGFYTIKQMNSDMSLDVTGASITQCANLQVYPSNTSSAQKWAISQNGRNGYRIQAKCSGFSVDANGSATNGANIQQYSNHDGDNQSWVFIPYNPAQPVDNGRYILLSGMDTGFELDLPGNTGDLENGANVALWDIGAPSQYNSFDVAKLDNGYYYITHAASGKRLDVVSADRSYGTNIGIQSESDMWSQQWAITKNGSGYTLRTRTSGYALDISGSKAENGANAHQWPYHGLANQTWYFVPAEYTVSYDANGGAGVPASQTKYWHTPALTLSSTIPTKEGFTFLYWMAGSNDSAAIYNPGDSYSGDEDLHLYAVWEQNGPRIKLSTNEISLTQFSDMVEIVATVQADESYNADLIWECIHAGDSTWDESMYFYGDNESAVIGPKERTGNYIVTCSTSDGEATASCIITVLPAPVIDIELSNTSLSLNAGDSYHLIEKITPSYTTLKDVIWKSDDPTVVSVANGDVFAVGEGTTTITCTASSDSTIKAICNVAVVVPVTSVTLNKSVYEFGNVSEGRLTLTATLLPDNASNKTVTWSSSNESVAKVVNGIVTPLEAGYTRITCASPDGPKGICDIIVHDDSIMQLPSALKSIEADAFNNSAIVEVIVSEGTTSIGAKAFANCKKLALISIPESATNIAADAFSGSGKVAIICDEPCYATEFAREKGIPYVLGTMPREVLIFTESNTISVGESVKLQGCVLPDNAPQTLRWTILEGKGIASIESNGSECIVSSTGVGHVTITATAINNATGTVDISIIEHPTTFGIRFDANGGLTDVSYRDAAFDVAIGTLPIPIRDYYTFTGWYTKASGGDKITSSSVFNDYYMGDITLYAHWTPNDYTYNIVYRSSNGTNLGSSSATYKYGTTNTISAPGKSGYDTPASQTIKWDETSKTITFTYSPSSVNYTTASDVWSNGPKESYYIEIQYRNRTADSVEISVYWKNMMFEAGYDTYEMRFLGSCNGIDIPSTTVVPFGAWNTRPSTTREASANSNWIRVPISTTGLTSVDVHLEMYKYNSNGTNMTSYSGWEWANVNLSAAVPAY